MKLASAVYKDFYPFEHMFAECKTVYHPAQLDRVNALLLWGGEDISPAVYGHHKPKICHSGPEKPSHRDEVEVSLAKEAIRLGIPIIAICRGAQLMCAVSGGSLFQHVTNHANGKSHVCQTDEGREITSNSLHHQMMNLEKVDHRRIAWIEPGISDVYLTQDGPVDAPAYEPEIVFIPSSKALCIQGHPEFMDEANPFVTYCLELTEKYILNKVQ